MTIPHLKIGVSLMVEMLRVKTFHSTLCTSTFDFRINEHVRLFIFKEKSYLCGLIRDCAFINFGLEIK